MPWADRRVRLKRVRRPGRANPPPPLQLKLEGRGGEKREVV